MLKEVYMALWLQEDGRLSTTLRRGRSCVIGSGFIPHDITQTSRTTTYLPHTPKHLLCSCFGVITAPASIKQQVKSLEAFLARS